MTNLTSINRQKKIQYFLVDFVDLFGVLRAKLVPTRGLEHAAAAQW